MQPSPRLLSLALGLAGAEAPNLAKRPSRERQDKPGAAARALARAQSKREKRAAKALEQARRSAQGRAA